MATTNDRSITAERAENATICLRNLNTEAITCVRTNNHLDYLAQIIHKTGDPHQTLSTSDPKHSAYKPEAKTSPVFNSASQNNLSSPTAEPIPPEKSPEIVSKPFNETVNPTIHNGRSYSVPENFDPVIREITKNDPITYELMVKVLGSESNFDNTAVSRSGAFSAGQFVKSTYLENVWKHRDLLSPQHNDIISENMEKYNAAPKNENPIYKYRVKADGDENAVMALSKDEYVVATLAREHLRQALKSGEHNLKTALEERINWLTKPENPNRLSDENPRIMALRDRLEGPMTYTDAKTFYLCGARGGAELLLADADPITEEHRAADYTTKTVAKYNKPVFEHLDGSYKSVPEYMAYMNERVGNHHIANNLDRTEPNRYLALNF